MDDFDRQILLDLQRSVMNFAQYLRKDMETRGMPPGSQFYVPMGFPGTDTRAVIESGPDTAEINSIEDLQVPPLTSSSIPDVLSTALVHLQDHADALRSRHMMESGNWNDPEQHERYRSVVSVIRVLAESPVYVDTRA